MVPGPAVFKTAPGWRELERCAALCNRAEFKPDSSHLPVMRRDVDGDASEAALLKCVEVVSGDVMAIRNRVPVL